MSTLTHFMFARIADDKSVAGAVLNIGINAGTHPAAVAPARVLAECEARRRIVEVADGAPPEGHDDWLSMDDRDGARLLAFVEATRILAQVFADHPDFDPAWRL